VLVNTSFNIRGEEETKKLIDDNAAILRSEGADLIVVMSELGIHKDRQLADIINPGVAVIFSAHTHEVTRTAESSDSGTLVVEAGDDGYLGRMDFDFIETTSSYKCGFRNRKTCYSTSLTASSDDPRWTLYEMNDTVAEDPEMVALVEIEREIYFTERPNLLAPPFMMQRLRQSLDTVVGHTDVLITRTSAMDDTFNKSFTKMIRENVAMPTGRPGIPAELAGKPVQIAMVPGFRFGPTVEAGDPSNAAVNGDITLEDVYRLFPVYFNVATATIDGDKLKEVIEALLVLTYSPNAFNQSGGWVHSFSGLKIQVDLTAPELNTACVDSGKEIADCRLPRVISIALEDDTPVIDSGVYSIAGCKRIPIDFPKTLCGIKAFNNVSPWIKPSTPVNGDNSADGYGPDVDNNFALGGGLTSGSGGFGFRTAFGTGEPITLNNPITSINSLIKWLDTSNLEVADDAFTDLSGSPKWPEDPYIQPLLGRGDVATQLPTAEDTCGYFRKLSCGGGDFLE